MLLPPTRAIKNPTRQRARTLMASSSDCSTFLLAQCTIGGPRGEKRKRPGDYHSCWVEKPGPLFVFNHSVRLRKRCGDYALARKEGKGIITPMDEIHEFSALVALGFALLHFALRLRRTERERQLNEKESGSDSSEK